MSTRVPQGEPKRNSQLRPAIHVSPAQPSRLERRSGSRVRMAGIVSLRQRPATANGTTFITLEDEDGVIQVIVWADLGVRQRKELLGSRLLAVDGRWEMVDGVGNLIASRLHDLSELLGGLDARSRDFH